MWEQIPLPEIKSTIRACSVPANGDSLAIWTDEGVFRVRLHPSPALFRIYAAKIADKNFLEEGGYFVSHGNFYFMHGDCGRHGWRIASNLLSVHPHGFTVETDEKLNRIQLVEATGNVCLTVDSVNVKNRLLIAHFSRNFSHRTHSPYFVVCDSTSLRVYLYRPPAEGIASKWSESGGRESQQSLWNAIIENPDDDTPRLIYADWLEENGDRERAEFIRLQCRIAERESREFIPPDDPDLVLNEQFQNQHGDRWVSEAGIIKGIEINNSYWRGFPICQLYRTSLATRKSQVGNILKAIPLEFINLSLFQNEDVDRLKNWELMSRWRNMKIDCTMTDSFQIYTQLFKTQRLNQIRKISFHGWFDQELNLALISNGTFPHLHTIFYSTVQLGNQIMDYSFLVGAKTLPQLKNVIFQTYSSLDRFQEREDIRKLASRVDNVYQVYRKQDKQDVVTRLHA